jgi:bifunctional DNA-binding transcriptional regulator/antitoxin component of YhaV-PrlF toxin-antitoxin module
MAAPTIPSVMDRVRLRAKNQLTLPESVARAVDAHPGDQFRIWVEEDGTIALRKSGASSYGKFPGLWGSTSEEIAAHLDELRDEWER